MSAHYETTIIKHNVKEDRINKYLLMYNICETRSIINCIVSDNFFLTEDITKNHLQIEHLDMLD